MLGEFTGIQVNKRLSKMARKGSSCCQMPDIGSILEDSHCNSRKVIDVLARANKAKAKCDHLMRTVQARLELPCDSNTIEPDLYPRPPPGTRREVWKLPMLLDNQHGTCKPGAKRG